MKEITITSPWFPGEKEGIPLDEYPRPSLVRDSWLNLNGYWQYAVRKTDDGEIPTEWDGQILVPFAVETPASGVRRNLGQDETLWYHRRFRLDSKWAGKRIHLNFEAVDYSCRCFINGVPAGVHRGGYLPFSFDITGALDGLENSIVLVVEDPSDGGMQPRGKQVRNPGQIWYEPTSGIWQTVWLEPVSEEGFIRDFTGSWDHRTQHLSIRLSAEAGNPGNCTYRLLLSTPEGKPSMEADSTAGIFELAITDPLLWSPDKPLLYGLEICMYNGSGLIDHVESYIALRTVDTAEGPDGHRRIRLNGSPIFLNALLDQGYWPESGMTAPDDRALIFDIEETGNLGYNCLRKHIKIESRRWYYHADRLGMLVIQDMVSGGKNWRNAYTQIAFGLKRKDNSASAYRKSGRSEKTVRTEFVKSVEDTVRHLFNHPSVICWVPFNESWGQYDALRIGNRTAELDPTRLVDHSSGWLDQGGGDFYSVHRYVLKLRSKPEREKRVHMVSEFGGYNLMVQGHLWDDKKKFGYGFYDSAEKLVDAYEKLINSQLLPLISRGLSAAVYTQLSDVETESNGLFTYDRKILKFDQDRLRSLNKRLYDRFKSAVE